MNETQIATVILIELGRQAKTSHAFRAYEEDGLRATFNGTVDVGAIARAILDAEPAYARGDRDRAVGVVR